MLTNISTQCFSAYGTANYSVSLSDAQNISGNGKRLSSRLNGQWLEIDLVGFVGPHFIALDPSDGYKVIYSNGIPLLFHSREECKEYCTDVNWRIPNVQPYEIGANVYLNKIRYVTRATPKIIRDYFTGKINEFNQLDQTDEDIDMKYELEMLLNSIDDSCFDNDAKCIIGKEEYNALINKIQKSYLDPRAEDMLLEYKTNQSNAGRLTIK